MSFVFECNRHRIFACNGFSVVLCGNPVSARKKENSLCLGIKLITLRAQCLQVADLSVCADRELQDHPHCQGSLGLSHSHRLFDILRQELHERSLTAFIFGRLFSSDMHVAFI